jgi:hypothetical protein
MALAQYLSTLPPCHTQAEVAPDWPLYVRVHADRIVMITVGATSTSVADKVIASIVNKPLLHVKIKENCNQCVQELKDVVEAYLNKASPPPGTRVVYVPNEWGALLP